MHSQNLRSGVMSPSHRDSLQGREPVKICTFSGCVGTMRFHPRQEEAGGPHTLEWPWHATWVCRVNPAHVEIATPAEEKALSGRSGRR